MSKVVTETNKNIQQLDRLHESTKSSTSVPRKKLKNAKSITSRADNIKKLVDKYAKNPGGDTDSEGNLDNEDDDKLPHPKDLLARPPLVLSPRITTLSLTPDVESDLELDELVQGTPEYGVRYGLKAHDDTSLAAPAIESDDLLIPTTSPLRKRADNPDYHSLRPSKLQKDWTHFAF